MSIATRRRLAWGDDIYENASVPRTTSNPSIAQQLPLQSILVTPQTKGIYESVRSARSARSGVSSQARPRERFREVVRKVIALQRGTAVLQRKRVGAEPGVDPETQGSWAIYGHIHQRCSIEVVDFSSLRWKITPMDNEQLQSFLDTGGPRESWVKVRWINVAGLSWDVIQALALKYDIHPLAVENMLQSRQNERSKADYFPKHLYLRVLCHSALGTDDQDAFEPPALGGTRSESPQHMEGHDGSDEVSAGSDGNESVVKLYNILTSCLGRKKTAPAVWRVDTRDPVRSFWSERMGAARTLSFDSYVKTKADLRHVKVIQELLKGQRVDVHIAPMNIILFRDGTLITVHQNPSLEFTRPIVSRIQQSCSGLRTTPDASLLVESIIDIIVHHALEVVQEYQSKILKLEKAVLVKPQMKHVVRLHVLQGDLILHRRTLGPLQTLVYSLRRYDEDRVVAMDDTCDPAMKLPGFMSQKAKIHLAAVHGHVQYALTSLDQCANKSDNLINYTFNMNSHEMGEVMRRLTLATLIFLPLTTLTGYFGMNFVFAWSYRKHSDVFYWIVALPVMAILIPIFFRVDLLRMIHRVSKSLKARELKIYR